MRRSVREALVGFSLLAAIVGGGALWLWLKGISLRRDTWTVQASFQDAAGLADRSPVSFRGVLVGNVRRVRVTPEAVLADLEITDPELRLARPTQALVGTGSLLGGDAVVALVSSGKPLPASTPGPRSPGCNTKLMLCNGSHIEGGAQASLGTVTETMQRILAESERQKLVDKLVGTTVSFDRTSNEAGRILREAQKLVQELSTAVKVADPILYETETQCSQRRRDIDHENQLHHIDHVEAHHHARVHGRQGDHHRDPGLIGQKAIQKRPEFGILGSDLAP